MGKKKAPPAAPNFKPIADAQMAMAKEANELAREQMGISRDQFSWFQKNAGEELALARQQADRAFGFQTKAFESDRENSIFAKRVGESQIASMDQQRDYAQKDRKRYEDTFIPMQDRAIREAEEYATPERREQEAGRLSTDVQRQAEAQRSNADQRLRSMGIDPSQVRSTSMANQMGVATAANQAMAANAGREMIDDKGRAMRADALNLGSGLPQQSAMGYQGAGASGQGALQAGAAGQAGQLGAIQGGMGVGQGGLGMRGGALGQYGQLTGTGLQWAGQGNSTMGLAGNMYGAAGNTLQQGFDNNFRRHTEEMRQRQQVFDNVGSVVKTAASFFAEGGAVDPERGRALPKLPTLSGGGGSEWGGDLSGVREWWDERKERAAAAAAPAGPPAGGQASKPQGYQPRFFAEGGSHRGALPTRQARDQIPAMLAEGEYVLPADVVRSLGLEKIDKLVAKYHRAGA